MAEDSSPVTFIAEDWLETFLYYSSGTVYYKINIFPHVLVYTSLSVSTEIFACLPYRDQCLPSLVTHGNKVSDPVLSLFLTDLPPSLKAWD